MVQNDVEVIVPAPTTSGPAGVQTSSPACPRTASRGAAEPEPTRCCGSCGARRPWPHGLAADADADDAADADVAAAELPAAGVAEAGRFRFPVPRAAVAAHRLLTALKPPSREGSADANADGAGGCAAAPPHTRRASSWARGPLAGAAGACWSMNAWAWGGIGHNRGARVHVLLSGKGKSPIGPT